MRRLFLVAALALAMPMTACNLVSTASPGSVANATTLDEKLALGVEASYKAARTAMELTVDAGYLTGARAALVRDANTRAYAAVQATRAAYAAGNADNYVSAAATATSAVSHLLDAIETNKTSANNGKL